MPGYTKLNSQWERAMATWTRVSGTWERVSGGLGVLVDSFDLPEGNREAIAFYGDTLYIHNRSLVPHSVLRYTGEGVGLADLELDTTAVNFTNNTRGLAADADYLYVGVSGQDLSISMVVHRVNRLTGQYIEQITNPGLNQATGGQGLAIDDDGNLYIKQRGGASTYVWTNDGVFTRSFDTLSADGIAFADDLLYIPEDNILGQSTAIYTYNLQGVRQDAPRFAILARDVRGIAVSPSYIFILGRSGNPTVHTVYRYSR